MDELIQYFDDYLSDSFGEYVGDIYENLQHEDSNYNNLFIQEENIMNNYPALRDLFEQNIIRKLSRKDIEQILKLVAIHQEKTIFQERILFFKGMSFCWKMLKSLNDLEKL